MFIRGQVRGSLSYGWPRMFPVVIRLAVNNGSMRSNSFLMIDEMTLCDLYTMQHKGKGANPGGSRLHFPVYAQRAQRIWRLLNINAQ